MARRKEIDPDRILDAAEAVILDSGGRQFTLDAVAERAGISKGGLIYSFPNKDALVVAALDRETARFQAAVVERVGEDADPLTQLLAYVEQALADDDSTTRLASFLLMAFLHAPDKIGPAQAYYRRLFTLFDPDTPEGRDARQATLAVEGLFLMRGLGFAEVSAANWESVLQHARDTIKALEPGPRE